MQLQEKEPVFLTGKMKLFSDEDKEIIDNDILKDMAMKFVPTVVRLYIHKITFSYKTIRGNKKENFRYLFAYDGFECKCKFWEYTEQFNEKYPHRPMLNAKILSMEYVGQSLQSLE